MHGSRSIKIQIPIVEEDIYKFETLVSGREDSFTWSFYADDLTMVNVEFINNDMLDISADEEDQDSEYYESVNDYDEDWL